MQENDRSAPSITYPAPLGLRKRFAALLGPYNPGRGGHQLPTTKLRRKDPGGMPEMVGGKVPAGRKVLETNTARRRLSPTVPNMATPNHQRRSGPGL